MLKKDSPGTFYMGTKQVLIAGDDLIIDDKRYEGNEGLWNLIMNKKIAANSYTEDDMKKYKDIMIATKALHKSDTHPKSSSSDKWKTIFSDIWKETKKKGQGLKNKSSSPHATSGNVIYLPSDPNALFDRLDLLLAGKHAGNTGLRNELGAICDELK